MYVPDFVLNFIVLLDPSLILLYASVFCYQIGLCQFGALFYALECVLLRYRCLEVEKLNLKLWKGGLIVGLVLLACGFTGIYDLEIAYDDIPLLPYLVYDACLFVGSFIGTYSWLNRDKN